MVGNLSASSRGRQRRRHRQALVLAIAAVVAPAEYAAAVNRTWDREAGTGSWSAPFNWSGNFEPNGGDVAIFPTPIPGPAGGDPVIILSNGEQVSSLTFNDSYTL